MTRFGRFERFMSGAGFPAFVLGAVVFYKLVLLAFLLIPADNALLGGFAEEFRVWCFGADPQTGRLELVYVVVMFVEPFVVGAVVLAVWWQPLRSAVVDDPGSLGSPLVTAVVTVLCVGGALVALSDDASGSAGPPRFPAHGLRTALKAPPIDLINQNGERVRIEDFRGKVVLLTASYSTCGHTCPLILAQMRRVMATLSEDERKDMHVLSVTLDPEHDTLEVLGTFARLQQFEAPAVHLLTGDPARVNETLDAMNVPRSRDSETGVIDHANLFLLIDRAGRLAYRLTLGATQEKWLGDAIRLLVSEDPSPIA